MDAAAAVLARSGPQGLSATAVASEADVSTPSLYYYFASMPEIAAALAERLMGRITGELGAAIEAASTGLDAAAAVIERTVAYYCDRPDEWRLLFQGVAALELDPVGLREPILPLTGALFAQLADRIEADLDAGLLRGDVHPRRLADLAWCQAQGILSMVMAARAGGTDTRFPVDELVADAVGLFRRGTALPTGDRGVCR